MVFDLEIMLLAFFYNGRTFYIKLTGQNVNSCIFLVLAFKLCHFGFKFTTPAIFRCNRKSISRFITLYSLCRVEYWCVPSAVTKWYLSNVLPPSTILTYFLHSNFPFIFFSLLSIFSSKTASVFWGFKIDGFD